MKTRPLGPSGLTVSAVGLGGMYLSITDRPSEDDAVRTIHAALDAGVTLIDTADVYCLDDRDIGHNERLIARALREKPGARASCRTKGGLERPRGAWTRNARPAHLRAACERSLKALGLERSTSTSCTRPIPASPSPTAWASSRSSAPRARSRTSALSNVSVRRDRRGAAHRPHRQRPEPLEPRGPRRPRRTACSTTAPKHGIAFLPYSPFGGARGAKVLWPEWASSRPRRPRRKVSPHRLVLAWMLAKSPVVIPIPGARRVESVVDSAQAPDLALTSDDVRAVEASFP